MIFIALLGENGEIKLRESVVFRVTWHTDEELIGHRTSPRHLRRAQPWQKAG